MKNIYQPGFDERRIRVSADMLGRNLPATTDKYFLRTQAVLKHRGWNPWVIGQLFARPKGINNPKFAGAFKALGIFTKPEYKGFLENGGRIWSLPEGSEFEGTETLMVFEGWAQDLILPETNYLGETSGELTAVNMGITSADERGILHTARMITRTLGPRGGADVSFFGARHYPMSWNRKMTELMYEGGAKFSSTDQGAEHMGQDGVGTSPHFLAQVARFYGGLDTAVLNATVAFHEVFNQTVPTVCLNDYAGREITDGKEVLRVLGARLNRFRLDTAGERVAEGAIPSPTDNHAGFEKAASAWRTRGLYLPGEQDPVGKYWWGNGVSISAAMAMVQMQEEMGFKGPAPMLTSGFSNLRKIRAFVEAERLLGVPLLNGGLGIGEVQPGIFTKMDVIGMSHADDDKIQRIHKAGRKPNPNWYLRPALGDFSGNPKNPYERMGFTRF